MAGLVSLTVNLQFTGWLKTMTKIQEMREKFMIQKSMTRKPFLEFSHTEAKSLDIFLCAVACLLSKASLRSLPELFQ